VCGELWTRGNVSARLCQLFGILDSVLTCSCIGVNRAASLALNQLIARFPPVSPISTKIGEAHR
jgi:hypothetical protein